MTILSGALAIIHHSPGLRCAETEVIARIRRAATNVGLTTVVITPEGQLCPGLPDQYESTLDQAAFALALHPFSPRKVDLHTYYALWQPVEFYTSLGYPESAQSAATHTEVLGGGWPQADLMSLALLRRFQPHLAEPRSMILPSVAEPLLSPRVHETSRAVVLGFNWDRRSGGGGRLAAADIESIVDTIRKAPDEAADRVQHAQKLLRHHFTIDVLIERLYRDHVSRHPQ
ncbi:hypothetical protein ACI2LF_12935 [Kribbella sp. NPDC020789]